MNKKNIPILLEILDELYPDARAELDYSTPYELLVAVILSAQCTDVRVNKVTKVLFDVAPNPEKLRALPIDELETIIRPCGLYKTKARNLHLTAENLVVKWNGLVPDKHEDLKALPGVGQKTANVVISNAFGVPAIAVDTHVFRVSNRIGLVRAKNVVETEKQLEKAIDRNRWTKLHHQLILHGRRVCKARTPNCETCKISPYCDYYKKRHKGERK